MGATVDPRSRVSDRKRSFNRFDQGFWFAASGAACYNDGTSMPAGGLWSRAYTAKECCVPKG
jgi:hypothetical protein